MFVCVNTQFLRQQHSHVSLLFPKIPGIFQSEQSRKIKSKKKIKLMRKEQMYCHSFLTPPSHLVTCPLFSIILLVTMKLIIDMPKKMKYIQHENTFPSTMRTILPTSFQSEKNGKKTN